jgi:hypothetical protein
VVGHYSLKNIAKDSDGDKFVNVIDCQPYNSKRDGWWQDVNLQKVYPARLNFTSNNLANRPKYYVSAINNLPALYFDGNDFLRIDGLPTSTIASENEMTIFLVQNVKKGNLNTSTINSATDAAGSIERVLLHVYWGNGIYFDFGYWDNGGRVSKTNYSVASYLNKPQVISAIKNSSSSSVYINSKLEVKANTASVLNTSLNRYLEIGTSFDGHIGEILIYNRALRVKEVMLIEQYLMRKWKIK